MTSRRGSAQGKNARSFVGAKASTKQAATPSVTGRAIDKACPDRDARIAELQSRAKLNKREREELASWIALREMRNLR